MRRYFKSENGYVESESWQPQCWINIESPDEEDFIYLSEELGVPESFLESAADEEERPRFDHEDGWLLTIIRIPYFDSKTEEKYSTLTFAVITKDELVISICRERSEMLHLFIERTRKRHIIDINKADFLLHIIYTSTSWYLKYLKEIDNTVSASIIELKHSVKNEDLYAMMQLQKSLVYFNTALRGNETLVQRIDKVFQDACDDELLDDVKIELQQALNTVDVSIEILDTTMDMLASVISNNVNEIMKKMTSVSIILMLPTLIASFYGMNVAVAFGDSAIAFWCIIGASIALSLFIFWRLKRANWM